MKRILVTGGAGFIGSHLCEALVEAGHKVIVYDNFSTGVDSNLAKIYDRLMIFRANILDTEILRIAMNGIDTVFHLAARTSVPKSVANPLLTHEVNATGTLNVLTAAHKAGVKKLVFASSSSVYGDGPLGNAVKQESMPPNAKSPYALSKLYGEVLCHQFYQLFGLDTIALRFFNVFGPRQSPSSQYAAVVPKLMMCKMMREPMTVYGDGDQRRDFTYIDNVVCACTLAASYGRTGEGVVVNVGCGKSHSVNELAGLIGADYGISYLPERAGDVRNSRADISFAEALLGYVPIVHFEDGVHKTWKWFMKNIRVEHDGGFTLHYVDNNCPDL